MLLPTFEVDLLVAEMSPQSDRVAVVWRGLGLNEELGVSGGEAGFLKGQKGLLFRGIHLIELI